MNDSMQRVITLLMAKWYLKIPKAFFNYFDSSTSIYLATLIEWHLHLINEKLIESDDNGKFFMTQDSVEFQVGLSKDQQRLACKKLIDKRIITIERVGIPPKNYYEINYDMVEELIENSLNQLEEKSTFKSRETQSWETHDLNPVKPRTNNNKSNNKCFSYEKHVASCRGQDAPSSTRLILRKNKSSIEFSQQSAIYRKDVMRIISYWNDSPGLPHHHMPHTKNIFNPNLAPSKTLAKIVTTIGEVLDGKFLQTWPPYSVEDIIKSIDSFKIRLTNPDYSPANKFILKSINLSTFFWNAYSSFISSMFLECLNNPPKLLKDAVVKEAELNPQITQWLQDIYISKILMGNQAKTFSQMERNKFIRGANFLSKMVKSLRQRANLATGPYEFCEYVVDALIEQFGRENVKPGNVGSEWTYNDLLPRYLNKLGRID